MKAQRTLIFFLGPLLWLALSACSAILPGQEGTPTASASPTATATLTPTVNWFPVTATPTPTDTPQPTVPTQAPPPTIGSLIFKDDFTDRRLWTSGESSVGTIAYGVAELDLAISQPKGVLISQRAEPVLTDFYLEITAVPSLCLNGDNYGIQFHMSSAGDFYRYLVSCRGQIRLERLKGGVGQVLIDWSPSAQAVPNATDTYRLGVWMSGKNLKLYLNGILQGSVVDDSLSSGGLGLFARSMGDNPVTVGFSDLEVYQPG